MQTHYYLSHYVWNWFNQPAGDNHGDFKTVAWRLFIEIFEELYTAKVQTKRRIKFVKRLDFWPKSRTFSMKIAKFTKLKGTVVHKIAEKERDKVNKKGGTADQKLGLFL